MWNNVVLMAFNVLTADGVGHGRLAAGIHLPALHSVGFCLTHNFPSQL